jgi:hypothetical protein
MVIPGRLLDELAEVGQSNQLWQHREEISAGSVSHGIKAHLDQLFLEVGVPEVLDLIVCSAGEVLCYRGPPEFSKQLIS